ncbi:hypothetical protein [Anaeromyxobacter terrae]|uniref:hypothetical protein n=1 Tax=Anaeromyxobacter terrae TaxID=2925406 RepID=UPI001F561FCF|nr:hypothetical protein [Anaeromyxobacter sp. SG22]
MRTAALVVAVAVSDRAGAAPADRLEVHTRVLAVVLERTTFADAERLLGPTETRHNGGDAAASATAACYVGVDGTVLALVSNSEMGGGSTVTHYELVARESRAAYSDEPDYVVPAGRRPRCARLASLSRATTTGGGLRLGMRMDDVRRLLGRATRAAGRHAVYESVIEVPKASRDDAEPGPWRARSVRVELERGVVVAIRVEQITSH